jgi:hypothetical protein
MRQVALMSEEPGYERERNETKGDRKEEMRETK